MEEEENAVKDEEYDDEDDDDDEEEEEDEDDIEDDDEEEEVQEYFGFHEAELFDAIKRRLKCTRSPFSSSLSMRPSSSLASRKASTSCSTW